VRPYGTYPAQSMRPTILILALASVLLVGWGPAVRDPTSGNRLTSPDAAALRAERLPQIIAKAAAVVDDGSGRLLYTRHANQRRAIASINKLMTVLIVLQHLPLNRVVTVNQSATTVGGSSMGLSTGQRLTVLSLLYGMLLPSGNDAATALALATAGSLRRFAAMMNTEAHRLHLTHSHFVTPHGLDTRDQYSSAEDVARLMQVDLRNPVFTRIVHTRHIVVKTVDGKTSFNLVNTDKLLGTYPGILGGKTGTTDDAGSSLVAAARRDGHTLIAVALGSTLDIDDLDRFQDATKLLNFGFAAYVWPPLTVTTWATPSLASKKRMATAPVPRWEENWISVGSNGLLLVPAD
jgi:D-alanyl-D-alanine carboxypeptidase (penicillin-binding protein 5/6)